MEKSEYLKHWQQAHPAERVNHHLRELLAHYIGFFPEGTIPGLSELALDIMALMELVDVLSKEKYYVK
ncbi:MAG TPA: hypothetical protein VFL76_00245 [Edaphocola sp.]|nr:hypothetical protein [Edaphocola sp.]